MKTEEPKTEKLVKVIALMAINYMGADYSEGDEFEVTAHYSELWIANGTVAKAEK